MENEDTQIITEIRGGKTSSFRFLVEKHQNKLYDLALRMTRSREDAEDIVQEAFVQAYSKLHQYNNTCSFANWIYTITLNIIRNKLRRKSLLSFCGFNQTLNDDDTQREFPDPWQNTEDNLDKKELQECLKNELDKLPLILKESFILRHFHKTGVKDIAAQLSVSENAVSMRLLKVRKLLFKELHPKFPEYFKNTLN